MSTPLTPQTAGSTTVYVVAGGNHVEIALDRSQSNELTGLIEVRIDEDDEVRDRRLFDLLKGVLSG